MPEEMTPYEAVRAQFEFPFELRPYQIDKVNAQADLPRSALYWEAGSGKTAGATHLALHRAMVAGTHHWIVTMPPILLRQWQRWLESVRLRGDEQLSTVVYHGPPKKRRELDLDVDFILTSPGMLKNDYHYLKEKLEGKRYGGIVDEAQCLKNIETATYKCHRDFFEDTDLILMSGTPLTTPEDAYAYIKLIAPEVYRNKSQFMRLHVAEEDGYGKIVKWENLDLLRSNLEVNASRVLRREVRSDLPALQFSPIVYDLDPAHYKLYRKLAEERLQEFEGGREIDALSEQTVRTYLQQIVVNWADFVENAGVRPAIFDLIEQVLEEIGQEKLLVVAHYIRSNERLVKELAPYGAVAIYGEVPQRQRDAALDRFISDPGCRVMVVQPGAGGVGLDGMQHVCSEMLVIEAPTTAPPFRQVVARLDRDGQTRPVNCRVAIANKTVQVRQFRNLLGNDAEINYVQRGYEDLRDAIYGG